MLLFAAAAAASPYRWFIVTNTFKTGIVVISLFVRDPTTQGVLALVLVLNMFLATRKILPYEYILTAEYVKILT